MDSVQREIFLGDAVRFFSGMEKYSIVKYAYTRLDNWTAVAQTHADPEVELFKNLIEQGKIPQASEMVHLGVGDRDAWVAKAAKVFGASGAKHAIGVDFSSEALCTFNAVFAENFSSATSNTVQADMFKTFTLPLRLENPLVLCDGITMGNAPTHNSQESLDESMARSFNYVLNAMQHRGHFVFTMHTDETGGMEGTQHVARYNNQANVDFTLSVIDIMKQDLGLTGIDRDEANYYPTWDRQGAVNHGFMINPSNGANERPIIFPGRRDIAVSFEEAKMYFTNRSIIIGAERIAGNARRGGFGHVEYHRIGNSPRVAFIAAPTP